MDRYPKDDPTAKKVAHKESSSHSRESLEKPVGLGWHPTSPVIGGLNLS